MEQWKSKPAETQEYYFLIRTIYRADHDEIEALFVTYIKLAMDTRLPRFHYLGYSS
jgi:hypothetical protein